MASKVIRVFVVSWFLVSPGAALAQRAAEHPGAVTLAEAGAAALSERRYEDALDAFVKAAALAPRDGTVCFGAGAAAFMLGRRDEAEDWLQRAVKLEPRLVPASQLLGEVQYRSGRLKDAISTYEAALERTPDASELAERLEEWKKAAALEDRSYTSRGAHFQVLFEGPADEALARNVVERLETIYWRIGGALTTYPRDSVVVVLYTTQQFRDITRSPEWAAASYDGRIHLPIRGALERPADLEGVLAHEFTHVIVATLGGPSVPTWLNEGLASFFEPDGVEDAERLLARTANLPVLSQLHGGFQKLPSAAAAVAYAYSTLAVRKMIELRGAPAVVTLLQDVARGADFGNAFQQRIAVRYEDFQRMVAASAGAP